MRARSPPGRRATGPWASWPARYFVAPARARRLEVAHDGPDGRDVLPVAVEPEQGGPGRAGTVPGGPPRREIPPRKLRPVSHHELDPLAVRGTDLSRVRDGPSGRRERDALLERPGEEHQHRVAEEQAEQDADEKHRNNLTIARLPPNTNLWCRDDPAHLPLVPRRDPHGGGILSRLRHSVPHRDLE